MDQNVAKASAVTVLAAGLGIGGLAVLHNSQQIDYEGKIVIAAGNTGYGTLSAQQRQTSVGLTMTINDPGNAELAITVGATHRDMPHTYGVSYFSSKGPTGDGRRKPDLLAPGEKIVSCGAGRELALCQAQAAATAPGPIYIERSGTSMAAAHVSGNPARRRPSPVLQALIQPTRRSRLGGARISPRRTAFIAFTIARGAVVSHKSAGRLVLSVGSLRSRRVTSSPVCRKNAVSPVRRSRTRRIAGSSNAA